MCRVFLCWNYFIVRICGILERLLVRIGSHFRTRRNTGQIYLSKGSTGKECRGKPEHPQTGNIRRRSTSLNSATLKTANQHVFPFETHGSRRGSGRLLTEPCRLVWQMVMNGKRTEEGLNWSVKYILNLKFQSATTRPQSQVSFTVGTKDSSSALTCASWYLDVAHDIFDPHRFRGWLRKRVESCLVDKSLADHIYTSR